MRCGFSYQFVYGAFWIFIRCEIGYRNLRKRHQKGMDLKYFLRIQQKKYKEKILIVKLISEL